MALVSRKAAMTAHPDNGGFEAKMTQVNEAYEVLTNPGKQCDRINTFVLLAQLIFRELRQRFDNGDDPNDPGSQGGAPFTGYGSPFGGGGGDHPFAQFFQQAGQRGFSFGRGHWRLNILNIAEQSGMCLCTTPLYGPQPAAYRNYHLVTVQPLMMRWWMESRIVVL
jgi:curved DNA-binding protein CbpA